MHKAILLIGGNEGDTKCFLSKAQECLEQKIGCIINKSKYYESEPWGFKHSQNFINQVIEIETNLSPDKILSQGQEIEKLLGRKAKTKQGYEGRPMDIDILFYDNAIFETPELKIPHPKLHERKFTLLPLTEKWKNHIHPKLNKTMQQLLNECNDDGWVKKIEE